MALLTSWRRVGRFGAGATVATVGPTGGPVTPSADAVGRPALFDGAALPVDQTNLTPPPVSPAPPATPPVSSTSKSTRKRGADRRPRRSKRTPTVVDEANVAALFAAGVSKRRIVQVMDLAHSAVDEILKRPDVREYADRLRQAVRIEAQTRIQQLTGKVYDWVDEVADSKDSKSFDNLMRGLVAMERISSSTSGDANKTQTQVTVTRGDLSDEAKALVEALASSGAKVANG